MFSDSDRCSEGNMKGWWVSEQLEGGSSRQGSLQSWTLGSKWNEKQQPPSDLRKHLTQQENEGQGPRAGKSLGLRLAEGSRERGAHRGITQWVQGELALQCPARGALWTTHRQAVPPESHPEVLALAVWWQQNTGGWGVRRGQSRAGGPVWRLHTPARCRGNRCNQVNSKYSISKFKVLEVSYQSLRKIFWG